MNISWFDALGTFTYKRSATPHQPFFLFTCPCCLFVFFSFLWSIVYTHIEFETLFFFSFLITPNNTYLYIICTLFKGHNISIVFFFFFFLYLAPSLGKQTRLVRRTKYSLPGSHTPAELILGVTSM